MVVRLFKKMFMTLLFYNLAVKLIFIADYNKLQIQKRF